MTNRDWYDSITQDDKLTFLWHILMGSAGKEAILEWMEREIDDPEVVTGDTILFNEHWNDAL